MSKQVEVNEDEDGRIYDHFLIKINLMKWCHLEHVHSLLQLQTNKTILSDLFTEGLAEMCQDSSFHSAMPYLQLAVAKGAVATPSWCNHIDHPEDGACDMDKEAHCVICDW